MAGLLRLERPVGGRRMRGPGPEGRVLRLRRNLMPPFQCPPLRRWLGGLEKAWGGPFEAARCGSPALLAGGVLCVLPPVSGGL